MSKIKDAISQVPSWPGFAIGAALVLSIGGWYYGTTYVKCTELRDGRMTLDRAVKAAGAGQGDVLDFGKVFEGDWNEVRIVEGHRPGQVPLNCPFGWDMGWRERQALIEAGQYTIIGLFKKGAFHRYIEYRGDWGVFPNVPTAVARNAAQFAVHGPKSVGAPYVLELSR